MPTRGKQRLFLRCGPMHEVLSPPRAPNTAMTGGRAWWMLSSVVEETGHRAEPCHHGLRGHSFVRLRTFATTGPPRRRCSSRTDAGDCDGSNALFPCCSSPPVTSKCCPSWWYGMRCLSVNPMIAVFHMGC
eukprot:UN1868